MGRRVSRMDSLFRECITQIVQNFTSYFHKLAIFVEKQNLILCNCTALWFWGTDKVGPRFCNVFNWVGCGVVGYKLVLILFVKLIQSHVIEIVVMDRIHLMPFIVFIGPEPLIELVDIRVIAAAAPRAKKFVHMAAS